MNSVKEKTIHTSTGSDLTRVEEVTATAGATAGETICCWRVYRYKEKSKFDSVTTSGKESGHLHVTEKKIMWPLYNAYLNLLQKSHFFRLCFYFLFFQSLILTLDVRYLLIKGGNFLFQILHTSIWIWQKKTKQFIISKFQNL